MKVLVMHDSRFGNGKKVADAIAEGLRETGADPVVADALEARKLDLPSFGAFVLGAPIRIGTPTWRAGGTLKRIARACRGGLTVAFVTQADPKLWGLPRWETMVSAAGLRKLMDGRGFHVKDLKGPLDEGELPKAREFGTEIGRRLTGSTK
jgi:flavorubredoxin